MPNWLCFYCTYMVFFTMQESNIFIEQRYTSSSYDNVISWLRIWVSVTANRVLIVYWNWNGWKAYKWLFSRLQYMLHVLYQHTIFNAWFVNKIPKLKKLYQNWESYIEIVNLREAPFNKAPLYLGIAKIAITPPPALKRALWGTFFRRDFTILPFLRLFLPFFLPFSLN